MVIILPRYAPPFSTYLLNHRFVWFSSSVFSPSEHRLLQLERRRCVPAAMVTRGPAQALPVSSGPAPRPLPARTLSPDSQDPTSYRPRPGPLPVLLLMAQTTTPGSLDPPPACRDPASRWPEPAPPPAGRVPTPPPAGPIPSRLSRPASYRLWSPPPARLDAPPAGPTPPETTAFRR